MVDEIVTRQELINAKRDARDLGKAVNEKVIVSPRYGEDFKSIPMVAEEFQDAIEAAAAAASEENGWTDLLILTQDGSTQRAKNSSFQSQIGSKASTAYVDAQDAVKADKSYVDTALSNLSTTANKFYPTLAEANYYSTTMAANDVVTIGEEANKGLWYKATAGATSLTKSAYDPLAQAKSYTDNKVKSVTNNFKTKALMVASTLPNDSYAMVTEDTEANNGLYVKTAGAWVKSAYAPVTPEGMLAYIKSYKSEPNNIFDAFVRILTDEPTGPNLITPSTVLADGFLSNATGAVVANASFLYTADYIPVKEGDRYIIGKAYEQVGTYYNSSKVRVGRIPSAASAGTTNYEFEIPAGVAYMRVNLHSNTETHVLRKKNLIYKIPVPTPLNYWQGKKVAWYGTSIPAGLPRQYDRDNYSYANLAVHDLGGTILNKAVPSSGVSRLTTPSFLDVSATVNYQNSMLDLIGTADEPDLFVFDFGVNDYGVNKAEINGFNPSDPYSSGGSSTRIDGVDENTFIGAYNVVIKALLTAKPSAKLCLLTHFSDDSKTQSRVFENLNNVITGIAKHWGVPVLQVHNKTNLINRNGINSLLAAMPDGLHPASGDASTVECLRHIVRDFLVSIA